MKVKVPATTANMGAGFDTFGMALGYYNYISIEEADEYSCLIEGEGTKELSGKKENLVLHSIRRVFAETGKSMPTFKMTMQNNIPLSRGMGSSAAAIVGGLCLANNWLNNPLPKDEILNLATDIEGHPDNVAPALLGGFVVSAMDGGKVRSVRFEVPEKLKLILCIPEYKLSTHKAREVLPKAVPFADAVFNVSHAALLMSAMTTGDMSLLNIALQDKLHQPYRFSLIPGSEAVINAANSAGALGAAISGSGASMIAYADGGEHAIGRAMCRAFIDAGLKARYVVVTADNIGAQIVEG